MSVLAPRRVCCCSAFHSAARSTHLFFCTLLQLSPTRYALFVFARLGTANALEQTGVTTVADLLWHLPTGMVDRRETSHVADLVEGEVATMLLKVTPVVSSDTHGALISAARLHHVFRPHAFLLSVLPFSDDALLHPFLKAVVPFRASEWWGFRRGVASGQSRSMVSTRATRGVGTCGHRSCSSLSACTAVHVSIEQGCPPVAWVLNTCVATTPFLLAVTCPSLVLLVSFLSCGTVAWARTLVSQFCSKHCLP